MPLDPQLVEHYLLPYSDGFWQWREGGEVVAWQNGRTIVFRGELIVVLRRLAPIGFPSMDALLLVLAATRENWDEFGDERGILAAICREMRSPPPAAVVAGLIEGLQRIHRLHEDVRVSPAAKAVLAEVLFEDTPPTYRAAKAQAIVAGLESGLPESYAYSEVRLFGGPDALRRSFDELVRALCRVDEQRLRLRASAGLDAVVQPLEEVLPDSQQVRALLAELTDDAELRGIATLARDLMAAVSLPRAVSDHDDLPVGGVSDITNRGSLDRLVTSELAHDDLTLAVRISLNEALYYRRESPPRPRKHSRAILIDAGIRCWGIPRVLATSVALALGATASRQAQLATFRARRAGVESVDLKSRAGLIEHLGALTVDAHPGAALDPFEKQTQPDSQSASATTAERIVITTEEAFADVDFRRALAARGSAEPLHVATVHRSGRFRLLTVSSRGTKVLREMLIDVDKLFGDVAPLSVPLTDPGADLPAIFAVNPFPLRLSHIDDPKRSWYVKPRSKLAILNDGRVMLWDNKELGALQLSLLAPRGELIWNSGPKWPDRSLAVVKCGRPEAFHVVEIDIVRWQVRSQALELDTRPHEFIALGDRLAAIFRKRVSLFDIQTGKRLQSAMFPPGMHWQNDRFFVDGAERRQWHSLAYDGLALQFHKVANDLPPLTALFDAPESAGPIGLMASGDLYDIEHRQIRTVRYPFDGPFHFLCVAAGSVYLESIRQVGRMVSVDLKTLVVTLESDRKLPGPIKERYQHRPVRHQVRSIDVDEDDHLILRFGRSSMTVKCDVFSPAVRLLSTEKPLVVRKSRRLHRMDLPSSMGINLRVATWQDGSRAYADSRGLLHLRSSDASVPQLTLVLNDDQLAGWSADQGVFGARYYTDNMQADAPLDIQHVQRILQRFTRALR